jgi:ABC-type Zn uptake system ZnuABC Zn-binding protein ZnuA
MRRLAAGLLLLLPLAACSRNVEMSDEPTPSGGVPAPVEVAVVDFPSFWLAERVGGDGARVDRIEAAEVASTDADLFVHIPGLDPAVDAAADGLPEQQVVDLTEDVGRVASPRDPDVKDPYVWFDPVNIGTMAQTLATGMVEASPTDYAAFEFYGLRALAVQTDALALDQRLQERLNPCRVPTLVVEAPVLTYFAKAYAFDQVPLISWNPAGSDVRALYFTFDAQPAVARAAARRGLATTGVDTLTEGAPEDDLLLGVEEVGTAVARQQVCPFVSPTATDRPG